MLPSRKAYKEFFEFFQEGAVMGKKKKGWDDNFGATHTIWGQKIDKRPRNIWGQVVKGSNNKPQHKGK